MEKFNAFILFLAIVATGLFHYISIVSAQVDAYPWDVNSDGVVDITDLMFVSSYFGSSNPTADINKDGLVDILDLVLVGQHFGEKYDLPKEITGKDGASMILIPAGEFEMGDAFNEGDDDERPVHTVYLDAFYMDKYEVTNAQYARFLNEYGDVIDPAGHLLINIDPTFMRADRTYRPTTGYEEHPVVNVSWYGAAAYAQYYGKRLPTEAEWEKAARGGLVKKRYPWGDSITNNDANYSSPAGGRDMWWKTSPVGSFAPNGYGLYDVSGNVWEWCADGYDSGYYSISPKNNPKGPGVPVIFINDDYNNVNTWRILRGGSWYSISPYDTSNLRCANRNSNTPASIIGLDVGFRCCQ